MATSLEARGSRVTVIRLGFFSSRLKASSVQGSRLKTQDFLQFVLFVSVTCLHAWSLELIKPRAIDSRGELLYYLCSSLTP